MLIHCHAPVRIDFAGAWTDVPHFADAFGGATLNAAIRVHIRGTLESHEDENSGLPGTLATDSEPSCSAHNGIPALAVNYGSAIPSGSGLGTSATLNVVWLALARRQPIVSEEDKMQLAELAFQVEKTLGIIGGKQDQYASAVGGINLFEFHAHGASRQPVILSAERIAELESLLVLCYTGKARLSSNIHQNVWGNFREGRRETIDALFGLRTSAYAARDALESGDLGIFSHIVSEQRHLMTKLDKSTTNAQIEQIFDAVAGDIMGGKPCGAGGGGCLFFIAKDAHAKERIHSTLAGLGLQSMNITFDFDGVVLSSE